VKEARRRAASVDGIKNALSLRLRDLGGLIRYAGDLAIIEEARLIEGRHIKRAVLEARPVEYQIQESYGSMWKGIGKDNGLGLDESGPDGYR
jgi:ATP-dependent Lon protease